MFCVQAIFFKLQISLSSTINSFFSIIIQHTKNYNNPSTLVFFVYLSQWVSMYLMPSHACSQTQKKKLLLSCCLSYVHIHITQSCIYVYTCVVCHFIPVQWWFMSLLCQGHACNIFLPRLPFQLNLPSPGWSASSSLFVHSTSL